MKKAGILGVIGVLVAGPVWAGVHRQAPSELLEPAMASPTYINALPAASAVTPAVVPAASQTLVAPGVVSGSALVSPVVVSGSAKVVSVTLDRTLVSADQCVAGLRVIAELALVGYDANPNRVFMRVAAMAAVAEPYAAAGVIPDLKGLTSAVDDLPFNGASVKEINKALQMTKTACAGMVKPKEK